MSLTSYRAAPPRANVLPGENANASADAEARRALAGEQVNGFLSNDLTDRRLQCLATTYSSTA